MSFTTRPDRSYFSTLALFVYVPSFLISIGQGAVAPVVPIYAKSLGAGLAMIGTVVAMKGLGPLVFNIPSGILIARFGQHRANIITTVLIVLVSIGTGLSRTVLQLAIMSFLMGGIHTTWSMCRVSFVKSISPPQKRGRSIAGIGGVLRIGGFIGPVVGGFVAKYFGFSTVFFVQAALVVPVIFIASIRPRVATTDQSEGESERSHVGLLATLRNHRRSFLTAGFTVIVLSMVRSGRSVLVPLWGDYIGLDVASIGLVIGLSSAIDMTLFYPAGLLMDRKGRRWAVIPCMFVMSVSFALIPLTGTFTSLLLVTLLMGFGNGIGSGIVMTMGSDLAPEKGMGEFLGVWFLVSGAGNFLGPSVIGTVAEAASLGLTPFLIAAVGFVGVAFTALFVEEPLEHLRKPRRRRGLGRT